MIFISYRREDSEDFANRICEVLRERFGREQVFFDTRSVIAGDPWPTTIARDLEGAKVVVAVIGSRWLEVKDAQHRRRIDLPDDVLAGELAYALEHGIPVLPTHMKGVASLRREALPDRLKPLADLQKFEIGRGESFGRDVDALANRISSTLHAPIRQPTSAVASAAFVGREKELAQLKQLLIKDRKRVVVVLGLPGTGKTALIEHFLGGKHIGRWFPGGVHPFRPDEVVERGTIPADYASLADGADRIGTILRRLSGKGQRALVVVDGVTRDEQLHPFLRPFDYLQLLATSQWAYLESVADLPKKDWDSISLGDLRREDARRVLSSMRGTSFPETLLDDLAECVGWFPAAVHWIGRIFHHPLYAGLAPEEFVAEIRRRVNSGNEWKGLVEVSLELLGQDLNVRRLLHAALVFDPAAIPLTELETVAGLGTLETRTALDRLAEVGLLSPLESVRGCLTMSSLFHDTVAKTLGESPLTAEVRRRFVDRMLQRLFQAHAHRDVRDLVPHIRRAVMFDLTAETIAFGEETLRGRLATYEYDIVDAVLPGDLAIRLWQEMVDFWNHLEWRGTVPDVEGVYRLQLGRALLRTGKIARAQQELESAIPLLSDKPALATFRVRALSLTADMQRAAGRPREAVQRLNEVLKLLTPTDDGPAIGSILRKLSIAHEVSGRLDLANDCIRRALAIHETTAVANDMAYDRCLLGTLQAYAGHLDAAERNLREAVRLHDQAYVAYDLNRLARVLQEKGRAADAIDCLQKALRLHERFYGPDSSNVAIDKTRLADAYSEAGQLEAAEHEIEAAILLHQRIFGSDSAHFAYDLVVQSRIVRREASRASSSHQRSSLLNDALRHAESAVAILDRQAEATTHRYRAWVELAIVLTLLGEGARAQQLLWQGRDAFSRMGIQHEVDRIDRLLLDSVFVNNPLDWRESATAYDSFLRAYPANLFGRLSERIIDSIAAEASRRAVAGGLIVLDLCCGTGILAAGIACRPGTDVRYVGLDCQEMIEIARRQDGVMGDSRFGFDELHGSWPERLAAQGLRPHVVVLGMCVFQFSPRERQLLLRSVAEAVAPDAMLLVSTSAADFECPAEAGLDSNAPNPFKATLYELAVAAGWPMPRPLAAALTPIYAKDDITSFACFLATCGFRLLPSVETIKHTRSFAEHAAFMRLKVISRKTLGKELDASFWEQVERDAPAHYHDTIHGVLITAQNPVPESELPLLFTEKWESREGNEPVRYATAALVRRSDGRLLMVKRGAAVRDFPLVWSLPSAMVEPGGTLEASLTEGLDRNLGVTVQDLRLVAVRLAPRPEGASGAPPWIIAMCLFEGKTRAQPTMRTPKYVEAMWVEEELVLERFETRDTPGDCFAALRDLIARRRVERIGEA